MSALTPRDSKAKKTEALVTALDNFELSGRIERVISWNDADQQIDEFGDDDDEYYEEDVDWHTGDCDDELEESADTVGSLRQMTQNFLNNLMATWTLMHLKCMHQQVAVFTKHVSLCLVSRVAAATFRLLATGAFDGLAQPSTDRKTCKASR